MQGRVGPYAGNGSGCCIKISPVWCIFTQPANGRGNARQGPDDFDNGAAAFRLILCQCICKAQFGAGPFQQCFCNEQAQPHSFIVRAQRGFWRGFATAHEGITNTADQVRRIARAIIKDADLLVRYVTAVVSVSSVLFFSASIPCILATKIPVSLGQLVVIWLLRTLLGILLAALCGRLAMAIGWLS